MQLATAWGRPMKFALQSSTLGKGVCRLGNWTEHR